MDRASSCFRFSCHDPQSHDQDHKVELKQIRLMVLSYFNQLCVSNRNKLLDLLYKTNDQFLYETQQD